MKKFGCEVISFKDFMSKDYKAPTLKDDVFKYAGEFYEENEATFRIAYVLAIATWIGAIDLPIEASADTGIDEKARSLYFGKFIGIAKWIIIGKGGWDTVAKVLKEDFDGAKRSVLQYMIVFVLLLGLPWGLDQIEDMFNEEQPVNGDGV